MKTESKIQEKRVELKVLSKLAKILVKEGAADTVNDALKLMYYQQGDDELNTLYQWNKKGFSVKKGEKALLLWGEPRRKKDNEDNEDNKAEQGEENEDDLQFFPICYVFSRRQVTESRKGGAK